MSSTAADVTKLISMIELHFPLKTFTDEATEQAWTASMIRFLAPYEPAVLARAAEEIIKTRDGSKRDTKFFPTPAEIIAVCNTLRNVAAAEGGGTPLLSYGNRDQSEFASWRGERADELIRTTELGAQAAREGWSLALWNFIRFGGLRRDKHGRRIHGAAPGAPRMPNAEEVAALRAEASAFNAAFMQCERGEGGVWNAALLNFGRTIKADRELLAREVLGDRRA